ncbi:MAG: hypothetical protein Q8P18_08705 [Pseudomonadota bacterium]|nr:hypothetical protein [Pseudomonadota bacterium]
MQQSPNVLDPRLIAGLEEEANRKGVQVDRLLTLIERLGEWRSALLPEDLKANLREQQRDHSLAVAELLIGWRRAGGSLVLVPEGSQESAAPPEASSHGAHTERGAPPEEPARIVVLPTREAVLEDDATERIPNGRPAQARGAESPPANLASSNALASLKAHVEGGGGFRVQAPPADWPARLAEQLNELLPAREPEADLAAVLRVVDALEKWKLLPPEVQATLVGLLAARLRALQEHPGLLADRRVDFAFGSLSAYVKRARPGYVYGLARWHQPNRETWEGDAEALYERLSAMVPTPVEAEPNTQRKLELIEGLVKEMSICPEEARSAVAAQLRREVSAAFSMGLQARNHRLVHILASVSDAFEAPEFRSLRRAIRDDADARQGEEAEDAGTEVSQIPADWAWWGFTKGMRALIVGGDPREPNRVRLEQAFGFAELEWVGAEYKRNNLHGVRDRVRSGRVDLVILLTRFTGHDADQIIIPACREMNIGFVCVPHGYGVVRVRQAIERFLDPEEHRK